MKLTINTPVILIIALVFSATTAFAGNPAAAKTTTAEKPQICLDVYGIALDEADQPINGVSVKLYKENNEMEWSEITSVDYHDHAFNFKLEANEYYTIEVSKDGYVTRSVGISTMIPGTVSLKQVFRYEFEVQLFKEDKAMDDYYLDFPVALVSYDAKHDVFDNDATYTKHIKTKIKESAIAANDATCSEKK